MDRRVRGGEVKLVKKKLAAERDPVLHRVRNLELAAFEPSRESR